MKLLRSLILASSALCLGSWVSQAADAANGSCSADSCWAPCSWDLTPHRFYVGGGAVYNASDEFHGWGGEAHLGYFFHKNHALEFQVNYFGSEADQNVTYAQNLGASSTATIKNCLDAKLEQWPLMLNYRYHGTFADFGCCDHDWMKRVLFNVGAGIGINFTDARWTTTTDTKLTGQATSTVEKYSKHNHETNFAGQIFGQLGYAFTDNFSLLGGVRAFWTDKAHFGAGPNTLHTCATTLVVDMGVNWRF